MLCHKSLSFNHCIAGGSKITLFPFISQIVRVNVYYYFMHNKIIQHFIQCNIQTYYEAEICQP